MEKALFALLCQRRACEVTLRGERLQMVLLPARSLLELRLQAEEEGDGFVQALRGNAALAARCLQRGGKAVFESGEEVLDALSAEEINGIVAQYRQWSAEADPSYESDGARIDALKKV